ncbi:N-acetylated-alpha-linked acidic dipeptidase 2-like [Penaeus japonicus]|uniref:N-acetylated-alpha-linked acidic dipeptidase 2-like n=1 Tax=Penaeus japonicus TaxID=27405 RepID=UPI001C70DD3A|nr:N-acetylated-alpha-linked acidic dipeptidase 2-like [Penaeus japonicus]
MKSSMWIWLVASITALVTVIVITMVVVMSPNTGGPNSYQDIVIDSVKTDTIREFLKNLTVSPHPAGSPRDLEIANWIKDQWTAHGLSDIKLMPYQVWLSHSDPENPNMFHILDGEGNVTYSSNPHQPPVEGTNQTGQESILSFNAFAANGTVQVSRVVYANYGSFDDFKYLEENGVDVTGALVIIRYGQLFRGDKVRFAEAHGAAGVILYTDPQDAAPLGPEATYPSTVYAPPGSTQLGSLSLQGDLLTPGYPAIETAYRIPEEEAASPRIPVQPVGYDDAQQILSILNGDIAPGDWQGGLNLTYRVGGDLTGEEVILEVHNINSREQVHNVIGSLVGDEEPDRYVLIGNHHDAWTYGGIDPSSATATQLELTRVFGEMYRDGWRPRRTLVFCSWAAEEPGVIGSTEFAEQFSAILKDRAVAYLNVDMVMEGNYSFMASSVPMLYDAIVSASRLVPNPDQDEVEAGRPFLYDTWVNRFPRNDSEEEGQASEPLFYTMGTGSDFRAYVFNLGIPSLDLCFTTAPEEPGLPLYHSAYETFDLALLMDPELLFHQATARMWGLLALEFSSQPVLPFSIKQYSDFAREEFKIFKNTYGGKLLLLGIGTANLDNAIKTMSKNVDDFLEKLNSADWNNDLVLRKYNDAMMLMERAFLSPFGLPRRPLLNHVLLAPSTLNGYTWDVFPGLRDLLRYGNATAAGDVKQHMAAVTHHFNMAAASLSFRFW